MTASGLTSSFPSVEFRTIKHFTFYWYSLQPEKGDVRRYARTPPARLLEENRCKCSEDDEKKELWLRAFCDHQPDAQDGCGATNPSKHLYLSFCSRVL